MQVFCKDLVKILTLKFFKEKRRLGLGKLAIIGLCCLAKYETKGGSFVKKLSQMIYQLSLSGLQLIAGLLLLGIFFLNSQYSAQVEEYNREIVRFYPASPLYWPYIGLVLVILVIVYLLRERLRAEQVFKFLAIIYLILGFYLILNGPLYLRADTRAVYDASLMMADQNYAYTMLGSYMYTYPYQMGLALYERILGAYSNQVTFLFAANLFQVLGINYCIYRISAYYFKQDQGMVLMTLVLSFMFLPQLFFIRFAYGEIPGLFCLLAGYWALIQYYEKKQPLYLILTFIFTALALILRLNYLIWVIAIILGQTVLFFKKRNWRYLLAVAVLALSIPVGQEAIPTYYRQVHGFDLGSGSPTELWLAMGTDPLNTEKAPGWYDDNALKPFKRTGFNQEKTKAIGRQRIQANLDYFKNHPDYAKTFFTYKWISIWAEPTFQGIWSGPQIKDDQVPTAKGPMLSLYRFGKLYFASFHYMKGMLFLIYGGSLIFVLFFLRRYPQASVVLIFFIGGVLFHTFWEGKSQYVYPYVILLVPLLAASLGQIFKAIGVGINKLQEKYFLKS